MACETLALGGMSVGCRDGIGGIKKAYFTDKANVETVSVDTDTTASTFNMITAMTMATGTTWYAYNFRKNTSDYTSTVTVDDSIGTFAVETVLNLQFSNMDAYKRNSLQALCERDTVCIVEDAKGRFWFFGETYPLAPTTATVNSGKAAADGNLGNVSLSTTDSFLPHGIVDTLFNTTIKPLIVDPDDASNGNA